MAGNRGALMEPTCAVSDIEAHVPVSQYGGSRASTFAFQ